MPSEEEIIASVARSQIMFSRRLCQVRYYELLDESFNVVSSPNIAIGDEFDNYWRG